MQNNGMTGNGLRRTTQLVECRPRIYRNSQSNMLCHKRQSINDGVFSETAAETIQVPVANAAGFPGCTRCATEATNGHADGRSEVQIDSKRFTGEPDYTEALSANKMGRNQSTLVDHCFVDVERESTTGPTTLLHRCEDFPRAPRHCTHHAYLCLKSALAPNKDISEDVSSWKTGDIGFVDGAQEANAKGLFVLADDLPIIHWATGVQMAPTRDSYPKNDLSGYLIHAQHAGQSGDSTSEYPECTCCRKSFWARSYAEKQSDKRDLNDLDGPFELPYKPCASFSTFPRAFGQCSTIHCCRCCAFTRHITVTHSQELNKTLLTSDDENDEDDRDENLSTWRSDESLRQRVVHCYSHLPACCQLNPEDERRCRPIGYVPPLPPERVSGSRHPIQAVEETRCLQHHTGPTDIEGLSSAKCDTSSDKFPIPLNVLVHRNVEPVDPKLTLIPHRNVSGCTSTTEHLESHSKPSVLKYSQICNFDAQPSCSLLSTAASSDSVSSSRILTSVDSLFQRNVLLGEGTYGVVYRALKKKTGETVALKKLRWESQGDGIPVTSVREVALLRELDHPNIVKLKGVHYESRHGTSKRMPRIFLEFEYLELDLRKYMKMFPKRQIPLESIRCIIYQILAGLDYCHSRRIIHRDIKPNNILLRIHRGRKRQSALQLSNCRVEPLSQRRRIYATHGHGFGSGNRQEEPKHLTTTWATQEELISLAVTEAENSVLKEECDVRPSKAHQSVVSEKKAFVHSSTVVCPPVSSETEVPSRTKSCDTIKVSELCCGNISNNEKQPVDVTAAESLNLGKPVNQRNIKHPADLAHGQCTQSCGCETCLGKCASTYQTTQDVENENPFGESKERNGFPCCSVADYSVPLSSVEEDLFNDLTPSPLSDASPEFIEVKIADFGLARSIPFPLRPMTHEVVTLWYRAPEILLGCGIYTAAVDIWAVGCVLVELLFGRALFSGDVLLGTPDDNIWENVECLPHFKTVWPQWPRRVDRYDYFRDNLDADLKDLIDRFLQYDYRKRPTAAEAMRHPWFRPLKH